MDERGNVTLSEHMGLGPREMIALVGGGGKSTILFRLGSELATEGRRVVLTTTTKMGRDQVSGIRTICHSLACAVSCRPDGPVMLVTGGDDHKVTGPSPEDLDALFRDPVVDYVVVEADGARGRSLKAPGDHEPVIPSTATTVVIAMGMDALGRKVQEVAHRVEKAVEFLGVSPDHTVAPADCAAILTHPRGVFREVPKDARVLVALTKVRPGALTRSAMHLADLLEAEDRISDVLILSSE